MATTPGETNELEPTAPTALVVPDAAKLEEAVVALALQNNIVAKSNVLIRASYTLSLQEQRLVLAAMSKLDSRRLGITPSSDQSKIRVTAAEFGETYGIDPRKAYEELREATNHLYERSINEIAGKKTTKLRWVDLATYHDGEGWTEVRFTPAVLPLLTLLREKFTSYRLQQVANLRGKYSIRIFEMLAQFSSTGLMRITLEDLVSALQLPYERYADIARRVIEPAVEELTAKSNLDINWRGLKVGKAYKAVEFTFKEQAQKKLF